MTVEHQVVGIAGRVMGSGIAEVAASAGFEVVLRSRSRPRPTPPSGGSPSRWPSTSSKGKLSADERDEASTGCGPPTTWATLDLCDLVIESVVEDLDMKRELFRRARPDLPPRHRSSPPIPRRCPVVELAMATNRPEQVIGLHFFNPAPRMPLVEIVPALTTVAETVDAVRQFAEDCGKEPVTVEGPGRLHRQRPALPVPEQRRAHARRAASPPGRTSTPPCGAAAAFPWAPSSCSTWWAWTRAWPSSTP